MLSYSQMQNHQMVIESLGQGYHKVEDKTRGKVFQLLCYYFSPRPPPPWGREVGLLT